MNDFKTSSVLSWDKVKEQKITISVASLIIGVMFLWNLADWSEAWHETHFFTQAQAQERQREVNYRLDELEAKVDAQGARMETHMDEFRLYAAISRISDLEEKMDRHCMNSDKPHTPAQEVAHREIEHELAEAREYKDCIVAHRQNCHLLMNQR